MNQFDSAESLLNYYQVINPSFKATEWITFFKKSGVDVKKSHFGKNKVLQNKIYLNESSTPLEFTNDGKVTYKGISYKLNLNQSPEENLKLIQKSWGGFKEFSDDKYQSNLISLIIPQAFASAKESLSLELMLAAIVAIVVGSFIVPLTTAVTLLALIFLSMHIKDVPVDTQLRCTPHPHFVDKKHGFDLSPSIFKEIKSEDQIEKIKKNMVEVCKSAELTEQFNNNFGLIRNDVMSKKIVIIPEQIKEDAAIIYTAPGSLQKRKGKVTN